MATTTPRMKITYATLSADNEELQAAYDAAVDEARSMLGTTYPMLIGEEQRAGSETFEDRSPIDTDIVVS
ncbi:MAG: L-glutamate gamma-semialdehyde dehydrogenase, partial [Chloroflexota bacterium]